jgi:hypothetical protein
MARDANRRKWTHEGGQDRGLCAWPDVFRKVLAECDVQWHQWVWAINGCTLYCGIGRGLLLFDVHGADVLMYCWYDVRMYWWYFPNTDVLRVLIYWCIRCNLARERMMYCDTPNVPIYWLYWCTDLLISRCLMLDRWTDAILMYWCVDVLMSCCCTEVLMYWFMYW